MINNHSLIMYSESLRWCDSYLAMGLLAPPAASSPHTTLPWLAEYAAWHRQHRDDPSAKYVMYSCHERMTGAGQICGGHGNRIKQITFTLRVAAATGRVLLVDWVSPEELTDYLEPGEIDWRPNAVERAELAGPQHIVYRMP